MFSFSFFTRVEMLINIICFGESCFFIVCFSVCISFACLYTYLIMYRAVLTLALLNWKRTHMKSIKMLARLIDRTNSYILPHGSISKLTLCAKSNWCRRLELGRMLLPQSSPLLVLLLAGY